MRISYDPEVDALSIIFRETAVTSQELAEGISGEFDAEGQLVGIEISDAVLRFGEPSTLRQVILEGIGPAAAITSGKRSQRIRRCLTIKSKAGPSDGWHAPTAIMVECGVGGVTSSRGCNGPIRWSLHELPRRRRRHVHRPPPARDW